MGRLLKLFTVCVFCVNLPSSHLLKFFGNENAFVGLNTMQLIQKRGYPVELHHTTTEDGYIVALHRIPHGRNKKSNPAAPPILLVHGLLNSAADWVCLDYSLGFLLADMGYDVWLANARGTTWSKQHTTLNVLKDAKEFWNFSWHEIGYYDLPANIDYVLKITKNKRLNYLGFSQGVTSFCVLMSTKPEYNEKITVAIFLAPAVIQYNVKSIPFRIISRNTELIRHLGNKFQLYNTEALGIAKQTAKLLCGMKSPFRALCLELLFFFTGSEDPAQYINVDVHTILSNTPDSVSLLQLIHYGQTMSKGEFSHLDLGLEENFKKYNSIRPPLYNLSRVTSPVALYYGKNDGLVNVEGVRQLRKMLPNVIYDHLVKYDPFGHVDFLYAKDVTALVYNSLLNILNNYNFKK